MRRFNSLVRSLAILTFAIFFASIARPAFAQSAGSGDSLQFRVNASATRPDKIKKIHFGADFGDVFVGTTSEPMPVDLVNTSNKKGIKIQSISVSPPFSEVGRKK